MAKEYIEREVALNECDAVLKHTHHPTAAAVAARITVIPAADVAPVVHGRWEFKHPNGFACSVCGEWGMMKNHAGISGITQSTYCPNCGAKMDLT